MSDSEPNAPIVLIIKVEVCHYETWFMHSTS